MVFLVGLGKLIKRIHHHRLFNCNLFLPSRQIGH